MEATLEFIGTATTLLRLGATTLLTDPNFLHRGQRAYLGKGLFSKRLTEPSLQPEQLPAVDGVLLSHLHGDHFDRIARERLDKDLPVLTTSAASRKLGSWGFGAAHGMSTWETAELAGVRVTAVPGRHARGPFQAVLPPVLGTVVEVDGFRTYVTGDTLYYPWLREVGERCGPIDAMVIHLGGTRALGLLVTMDGEQGADLVETIRPTLTIPVHHDDYTVFRSPLGDFLAACRDRDLPTRVQPVARGQVVPLRSDRP
ncbi:MBL fold metallo-hydrolase [Nocardioides sp. URHA0032]|uniref:MBL fold metallo-hydrolase n=1 Tax=Nocardioides sp. URHA0032 TaxID=1380388 RepID=UPI0005669F7B|nr:MBL fold metallo-hydrolase [Nocardioides sp. URHA0032]